MAVRRLLATTTLLAAVPGLSACDPETARTASAAPSSNTPTASVAEPASASSKPPQSPAAARSGTGKPSADDCSRQAPRMRA